jgi:hypothetical protein
MIVPLSASTRSSPEMFDHNLTPMGSLPHTWQKFLAAVLYVTPHDKARRRGLDLSPRAV